MEKKHPWIIRQLFAVLPRLLLALDEPAHDLGIRQMAKQRHLRHAAKRARSLGLHGEPLHGFGVVRVV